MYNAFIMDTKLSIGEKAIQIHRFSPTANGWVRRKQSPITVHVVKPFGKAKELKKLSEIGNDIFSILRLHINKENNMLFMMADMHLSTEEKKKILDKFKKAY